jgi:hypothetical protein
VRQLFTGLAQITFLAMLQRPEVFSEMHDRAVEMLVDRRRAPVFDTTERAREFLSFNIDQRSTPISTSPVVVTRLRGRFVHMRVQTAPERRRGTSCLHSTEPSGRTTSVTSTRQL